MAHYKSIWISDLHLGSKGCKAIELCKFLKENTSDNLFLVGDIIDGWKLTRNWHWPQEHSNVIRRLLTKAKRGTKITYVVGNHDEFLRPWLKHKLLIGNLSVVNQITYIDIKGRKWIITHGDLFDHVTRNWKWVSLLGDHAYSLLLSSNGLLNNIRKKLGLGYWSLSQYIKANTKKALDFIWKFEESVAKHAENENAFGIICGHIHTPAIKEIDGIMYLNDGDWVETCSAIVETHAGDFQLLILNRFGQMEIVKTL